MQYRCKITDQAGNTVISDSATIHIGMPPSAIVITQQPVDVADLVGEYATFSVVAEGEGLTYQWQYCRPGGGWLKSSSTEPSVTTQIVSFRDGMQYRCKITDANGNFVISEAATITVLVNQFTENGVTYYILSDTTVEVKSYNGDASSVTIPSTVRGYTVVRVGDGAFAGNDALASIDLPDSIQTIGSRAFANCPSLKEVK